MSPLHRIQFLSIAVAGVLVALTAASTAARADELVQNLGPVGPYEPILASAGNKRLIAFFVPDSDHCAVNVVVWNNADPNGLVARFWPDTASSAERVLIRLNPGQFFQLNSIEDEGLSLKCGGGAASLALVGASRFVAAGMTQ
jgi:hypothetical protein